MFALFLRTHYLNLHSEAQGESQQDTTVLSTNLTVQLIGTDAKPCSRGLRLSIRGGISSQQIQSPQGVNVEVFLQLQSSFQDTDGVCRLLFQLRSRCYMEKKTHLI